MNADHESLRLLLGGYLLGGLDVDDQDTLDAHLVDCAACRDELAQLEPVPELMQRMPVVQQAPVVPVGVVPSPERVVELLRRMRAERARTRRTRVRLLLAAAASVAVLAVGIVQLLPGSGPAGPDVLTRPTVQISAEPLVTARFVAAAGSALAGEAVLTPKAWGVSIALDMSSLPGDGPFMMQIRGPGGVEQAACWGRTPTGRARVIGASSMQLPTVQSVVVTDYEGHVLGTARLAT
jgi:anti-sigma factor RsiW